MKLPNGMEQDHKSKVGITVKLTEIDLVQSFLKEYNNILEDERIDKNVRDEYEGRLEEIMKEKFDCY